MGTPFEDSTGPIFRCPPMRVNPTYDGADKAAPCHTQLDVAACFAPLLGWVLRWWRGDSLALAVDATPQGDRWVALVVSVLYRGCAIPVAWHVLPANRRGAWMGPLLRLQIGRAS